MSERDSCEARRPYVLAALLCWATLTTGCGDNDEPPVAPPRPIPGCEAFETAACDTLTTECQQSRLQIAACLRGAQAPNLPAVSIMTEKDYADYLNALYEGANLARTNHFEVAMTWLGLAQPGSFAYTPLEPQGVADWFGTYRWRQQDLLIIDHGKPADDAASNVELVASLIRYLRDRDINLGRWSTEVSIVDVDSNWGADAMYFGEARFYSNRYRAALEGVRLERFDELGQINSAIREDVDWIRTQPSSYVATNDRFPENFGARLACLAYQRDGAKAVNGLFASKFLTHQLMATETEQTAAPLVKYHARPVAPSAWFTDPIVTAIGAWGLFLSLSRTLTTEGAWSLALSWRGDQIFVFKAVEPAQDTALIWQLEMSDEGAATALERELGAGTPGSRVQRSGTFVTLAVTTNDDPLDWAFVKE